MKKILAIALALVMVLGLVACTGDSGSDDLNIAVFYYTYSDTYISSVRAALDAELTEAGVTYTDYDSAGDQATQNDQVNTAITAGANLLIVNLVTSGSPDAAQVIIAAAGDIPVIFFNRAVESDDSDVNVLADNDTICFIGTDAPEAGHMQGQMIGEYVIEHFDEMDLNGDGVISYALMKGDEANVEAIYRTQYGVEDANALLTAAGLPELVYFDPASTTGYQVDLTGQWATSAALDYMTTNLSQYNETNGNMIELVICNNDSMAEGVIQALKSAGYNDGTGTTIPVFGVDATDSAKALIAAGSMTGTVKQDAEGMAAAIAAIATSDESIAAAVSTVAASDDSFSVADGYTNKLYVAYAPYTGE